MKEVLLFLCVCAVTLSDSNCRAQASREAQEADRAIVEKIENAAKKSHVLLPSPPLGFHVVREPVTLDGKFIGFNVLVQKEGVVSKVMIKIDLREDADFSIRGWRSGALKGYVHGMESSVTDAGYRVIKRTLPDIKESDLKEQLVVGLGFENADGRKLYVNQRIFFDTRGIAISVITDNQKELSSLTEWANKIKATTE